MLKNNRKMYRIFINSKGFRKDKIVIKILKILLLIIDRILYIFCYFYYVFNMISLKKVGNKL